MWSLSFVVFCQCGAQAQPAAVNSVTWSTSTHSDVAVRMRYLTMTAPPLSCHYHIVFTGKRSGCPK